MKHARSAGFLIATVGGLLCGTSALAQEAGQASSGQRPTPPTVGAEAPPPEAADANAPAPANANAPANALPGDIIVTAQKRAERLQDVPIAITAISGNALANRQINDVSSLTDAVPAVTFARQGNPANNGIRIRGIGSQLFGQGLDTSVGIVIDGVVLARNAQSYFDFADLDRIEVLKGPQGTLFGRNATAGAISIITARPSSTFTANGDVTIAEGNEYRGKASISGPLGDTLGVRLSGFINSVGGYIDNVTLNRKANTLHSWGVRGKVEWKPAPNLDLYFIGDYHKDTSSCCHYVYTQVRNPALAQLLLPVVASPENSRIADNIPIEQGNDQTLFSLQADWDVGAVTVTSISALQDFNLHNNTPSHRINQTVVRYVGTPGTAATPVSGGSVNLRNYSEELRLASNGSSRLNYVAGFYGSSLELDRIFRRRVAICNAGVLGQPCGVPVIYQSGYTTARLKSSTIAAFGQVDYRLVGGLKAILGGRIQQDKTSVRGSSVAPNFPGDVVISGLGSPGKRSTRKTGFSGRAGLQYEFSRNLQTYGTYNRGYKGQGFNTDGNIDFARQAVIQPEYVDAYELGLKGKTADNVLSFDLSMFLSKFRDLQVNVGVLDPVTGVTNFNNANAGRSETRGFEISTTVRPTTGLSLDAAVTYSKATFDLDNNPCAIQDQLTAPTLTGNFPINSCYRSRTVVNGVTIVSPFVQNTRGGQFPNAPKWRFNVTPRYEQPVGSSLIASIQSSISYQSDTVLTIDQDPLLRQPSYTIVDGSIALRAADGRWSASLFVKNMFDKRFYTYRTHSGLLNTAATPFDLLGSYPKNGDRYFGGTLGFRY